MKKQEMIDAIIQEEKRLWNDLQQCIDVLGINDPLTDIATARWISVNDLKTKLQIR